MKLPPPTSAGSTRDESSSTVPSPSTTADVRVALSEGELTATTGAVTSGSVMMKPGSVGKVIPSGPTTVALFGSSRWIVIVVSVVPDMPVAVTKNEFFPGCRDCRDSDPLLHPGAVGWIESAEEEVRECEDRVAKVSPRIVVSVTGCQEGGLFPTEKEEY